MTGEEQKPKVIEVRGWWIRVAKQTWLDSRRRVRMDFLPAAEKPCLVLECMTGADITLHGTEKTLESVRDAILDYMDPPNAVPEGPYR